MKHEVHSSHMWGFVGGVWVVVSLVAAPLASSNHSSIRDCFWDIRTIPSTLWPSVLSRPAYASIPRRSIPTYPSLFTRRRRDRPTRRRLQTTMTKSRGNPLGKNKFVPLKNYKVVTSQKAARKITAAFHLEPRPELRRTYQNASVLLTHTHKNSSHFIFSTIERLGRRPRAKEPKLRTLEVGAVNLQLSSCAYLDVLPIDIRSRHPQIKELDFFKLELVEAQYDVISIAMVLNCVPNESLRGEMLVRSRAMLKPDGLMFVVLPRRIVDEARMNSWVAFFSSMGFAMRHHEFSPKISYFCFERTRDDDGGQSSGITSSTTTVHGDDDGATDSQRRFMGGVNCNIVIV